MGIGSCSSGRWLKCGHGSDYDPIMPYLTPRKDEMYDGLRYLLLIAITKTQEPPQRDGQECTFIGVFLQNEFMTQLKLFMSNQNKECYCNFLKSKIKAKKQRYLGRVFKKRNNKNYY